MLSLEIITHGRVGVDVVARDLLVPVEIALVAAVHAEVVVDMIITAPIVVVQAAAVGRVCVPDRQAISSQARRSKIVYQLMNLAQFATMKLLWTSLTAGMVEPALTFTSVTYGSRSARG